MEEKIVTFLVGPTTDQRTIDSQLKLLREHHLEDIEITFEAPPESGNNFPEITFTALPATLPPNFDISRLVSGLKDKIQRGGGGSGTSRFPSKKRMTVSEARVFMEEIERERLLKVANYSLLEILSSSRFLISSLILLPNFFEFELFFNFTFSHFRSMMWLRKR